tara:strand:- start:65 stop:409 length:345 start_codon:yes stop_codon:yes gene_type:complete
MLYNSSFNYNNKNVQRIKYILIFVLLLLPTLPFYVLAIDWGRWINISYSMSIITVLYLLKYNFLKLNKIKTKNNFIVTILFIIFAFGWSPKTTMTEDISSIPIYRKINTFLKSF